MSRWTLFKDAEDRRSSFVTRRLKLSTQFHPFRLASLWRGSNHFESQPKSCNHDDRQLFTRFPHENHFTMSSQLFLWPQITNPELYCYGNLSSSQIELKLQLVPLTRSSHNFHFLWLLSCRGCPFLTHLITLMPRLAQSIPGIPFRFDQSQSLPYITNKNILFYAGTGRESVMIFHNKAVMPCLW